MDRAVYALVEDPLDIDTLATSARKSARVLIVHDAWRACGIGAEIAASVYETCTLPSSQRWRENPRYARPPDA